MAAPLIIRNDTPIFGWVFAAIWFGFLSIFTWLFVRDGGFRQFDYTLEVMILAGFWLHTTHTLPADILATAQVRTDKDSDGDPHYSLILVPPGGDVITLKSSGDCADIEALREKLVSAL